MAAGGGGGMTGGGMAATIRIAAVADAEALAALAEEFHAAHGDPTGHLTPEAIRRDGFGADPEFQVLVAEARVGLVGYALFYDAYEPSYAARGVYMADLYVRPSARRRGVGRRLIAAVAGHARAHGRRYVWWVAQAANTRAQAFYRTLVSVELATMAYAVVDGDFAELADAAETDRQAR